MSSDPIEVLRELAASWPSSKAVIAALDAAIVLAQQPAPKPEGEWVLVPREPTPAMHDAGHAASLADGPMHPDFIDANRAIYAAMLAAAPKPESAEVVCPECKGEGSTPEAGIAFGAPVICPDCAGSGRAEDSITANEAVGEAGTLPGSNGGFTTAVFKASEVPVGTKLYTAPPRPEASEERCRACGLPPIAAGKPPLETCACARLTYTAPHQASAPVGVEEAMERAAEEIERYSHAYITTIGASRVIRKHMAGLTALAQQSAAKPKVRVELIGKDAVKHQQPAADDSEQFRRGWVGGFAEGRKQPAAVDGRLRTAVLGWWAEHEYDTDSHQEDGERNVYSEPPEFVRIAQQQGGES